MVKADGTTELRKFKTVLVEPTAGEIAAKAAELAKAAGDEGKWQDHIEAAREELTKAKESPNPQADAANVPKGGKSTGAKHPGIQGDDANEGKGETKIGDGGHKIAATTKKPGAVENNEEKDPPIVPDSTKGKGAESNVSAKGAGLEEEVGDQVWVSKRLPGQSFAKKAELRQALLDLDATEAARVTAAPVIDALKGITDALDKREGKKVEFTIAEIFAKGHDAKVLETIKAPAAEWETFKVWLTDGDTAEALTKAMVNAPVPPITIDEAGVMTVPLKASTAIGKLMAKAVSDKLAKREFTQAERDAAAKDGSAMADGSFPIKNKEDLKNAVTAHGRAKNPASAKRHIKRRAAAIGATDELPDDWKAKKITGDGDLAKAVSLYGVSNLLMLIASLENAEEAAEVDEYWGGAINITKELKDRFGQALVEVGDIAAELLDAVLASMKDEESREAAMERAAPILDLMKIGARHSKADKATIKKAHDAIVDLDKDCCPAGDGEGADKAVVISDLQKRLEANDQAFSKQLGEISTVLKDVAERVRNIEDTPMPMVSQTFRTVTKGHDLGPGGGGASADAPADDPAAVLSKAADAAIRLSHQRPFRVG
jgi:hypothetical protein